jgi:hypothetical protein
MATPEFLDTPSRRVPGQVAQVPGNLVPAGYQQLTSLSSASGLNLATNAYRALIQAQDQNVRWRDDGTDPSATVGMVLAAGETMFYTGDLSAIKFIEVATSAIINVSYYR